MPYKPAEIERLLVTILGFSQEMGRNESHRWYVLDIPGVPRRIRVFISHSRGKEYHKGLESAVARELHVATPFFRQLMRGEKTRDDYFEEVRRNPHPPFA